MGNVIQNVEFGKKPVELPEVMIGTIVGGRFHEVEQSADSKEQIKNVGALISTYMEAVSCRIRVEQKLYSGIGDADYDQMRSALPLEFFIHNRDIRQHRLSDMDVITTLPQTAEEAWNDVKMYLDHVMPNDGGRICWKGKPCVWWEPYPDGKRLGNDGGWVGQAHIWCESRMPPKDISATPVTIVRYATADDWIRCVASRILGESGVNWLREHDDFVTDDDKNRRFIEFVELYAKEKMPKALRVDGFAEVLNRQFLIGGADV